MTKEELQAILRDLDDYGFGELFDVVSKLVAEIARLQEERRNLWRFVKPVEGAPVVYVGVHAVRWYEAAGEYEPTAGFVQAFAEEA
jgi:hypothetical protein